MKGITATAALIAMMATAASASCPKLQPNCEPRYVSKDTPTGTTYDATSAAIGGLTMPGVLSGEVAWSAGVANVEGSNAVAAGMSYGISDRLSITGKVSHSDGVTASFVGIGGKF